MGEVRDRAKRALESERIRFEADRKRSRDRGSAELAAARKEAAARTSQATIEHDQYMQEITRVHKQALSSLQKRLCIEADRHRKGVLDRLQTEAREKERERSAEAKWKAQEELTAGLKRLQSESADAVAKNERETQERLQEISKDLEGELAEAVAAEAKAMDRYMASATKLTDEEGCGKEMEQQVLAEKREIEAAEQRLAVMEQTAERTHKEATEKLDRLRSECHEERLLVREEVTKLIAAADDVDRQVRLATDEREQGLRQVKRRYANELGEVEGKIATVIKRKEEQLR
ncbi:unnamed protein product [Chrysoparadoxa australica]